MFIDDDIPALDVVTDAPAEPVDSCCTVHCMLPQTTSNTGHMSVSGDLQFLSFLRGHLFVSGTAVIFLLSTVLAVPFVLFILSEFI